MSATDLQFKSFIDRILRCREAEDAAKEDTKAVYAEMKAEGYEKAIVGKLVNELRKRAQDSAKVDEAEAILDLYREAYERASGTTIATHVHAGAKSGGVAQVEAAGQGSAPVQVSNPAPGTNQEFSYERAVELVIAQQSASVSFIQRSFQIGFNRAAACVERMQVEGIVSVPNHEGKRAVLRSAA